LLAIPSTNELGGPEHVQSLMTDNDVGRTGTTAIPARPRALLVDDEASVLSALFRLLRRHGFDVTVATDPNAAITPLNDVPLDVIVSDFNMPKMTGAQFLREARRRLPECTRVLLSGQADRDAVIDVVNDGAIYCYLDKLGDGPSLIQTLNEAVELLVARSVSMYNVRWLSTQTRP
jgi:DNA-binding NtrC family response regulator